jgi:predicted metal-dependent HD superfamily phosphohydrolase
VNADRVAAAWRDLAGRFGLADDRAAAIAAFLIGKYSDADRHYHGLGHVARLLDEAEALPFTDRDAVELAILFHDVIYDPARRDNEERSAAALRERLGGLIPDAVLAHAEAMILATRRHEPTGDPEADLFLDLDLAILAAPWLEYARYAEGVMREYAPIHGEDAYCRGRLETFLGPTLARGRVFLTDRYRLRDPAALANMGREAEALRAGLTTRIP